MMRLSELRERIRSIDLEVEYSSAGSDWGEWYWLHEWQWLHGDRANPSRPRRPLYQVETQRRLHTGKLAELKTKAELAAIQVVDRREKSVLLHDGVPSAAVFGNSRTLQL